MRSKIISWATAMLCAMTMTAATAADDMEAVTKAVQQLAPTMKPDRIVESPVPGLYEVTFGPEVLYVTKDGRFGLRGELFNLADKENLTESRRAQGRLQLINSLSEKEMIVFAAPSKKQKHVVTVFTDADCSYCRKLHAEMADYNKAGITIRYLAFPRSGVDTPSYQKMVGVWCAKDRRAAMTNAKLGENVEEKTCANPVQKHLAMAERIGVSGTPTMVLEDGSMVPGYLPPDRLAQALEHIAVVR